MYSLEKKPENSFELNGVTYQVNLSFNRVIKAFSFVEDENLSDGEKVERAFDTFIVDPFPYDNVQIKAPIVAQLFDYINANPYGHTEDDSEDSEDDTGVYSDFDFEQDAGAIYASFLQQYGINLSQEFDVMHWDEFIALFQNLNSDTPIQQIRRYRNDDLTGYKDDNDGLIRASQMQEYFKLDKVRELEQSEQRDKFSGNAASVFASMFNDAD